MSPRSIVRRSAGLAVVCAVVAASCTPVPPPSAATPTIPVAATTAPPPPPEPELDLSPVPEPDDLFGVLRVGAPVRDLLVLRDLVPAHTSVGQLLALGPEGITDLTFGSLATEIDTGLPLDVAFSGDGSTMVGSVVLRDLELAKKAGAADFDFRDAPDGSIAVVPRRRAKRGGLVAKSNLACTIYPGGEPVRHHLVCGSERDAVAKAGPYLARTQGRVPATPGVRFDVPEPAMATLLGERQSRAEARTEKEDSSGARLATSWTKALSTDVADLGVALSASGTGVLASADLRFRSTRSPLSLVALAAPGGPVPPMFWSVPKDADIAVSLPGASAEALRSGLGPTFWTEIADAMGEDLDRDLADASVAELRKLVLTGGPFVFAHGPPPPPKAGTAGTKPAADPVKRFVELRNAAGGWALVAAPEPVSLWTAGLHELVRLGKNPARRKTHKPYTTLRTRSTTSEIPLRATDNLPKGSLHLVMHEAPNPTYVVGDKGRPPAEAPFDTHIFVGGTAETTWIVVAPSEPLARAKLQQALAGGAEGIGALPEMEPFRATAVGGIGFATMRGIVALVSDHDSTDALTVAAAKQSRLALLPSGGNDRMLLRMATRADGDAGGQNLHLAAAFSLAGALDLIQYLQ